MTSITALSFASTVISAELAPEFLGLSTDNVLESAKVIFMENRLNKNNGVKIFSAFVFMIETGCTCLGLPGGTTTRLAIF